MSTPIAYQTDADGYYVGVVTPDPNPVRPGEFILPGGAYWEQPPELTGDQRARYVDGAWQIVEPEIDPDPPSDAELLDQAKSAAQLSIDVAIDQYRRLFITGIIGQSRVYTDKEAEGRSFIAEKREPVDLTLYPYIDAEISLTGETALATATQYVEMADLAAIASPPSEALRVASKGAVRIAVDIPTVNQEAANFEAALAALPLPQ